MKIRILFFLLSLSYCQQLFTDLQNCKTKDEKGNEFNLEPLKKSDYWKVRDISSGAESQVFSMEYLFNFCDLPVSKVNNLPFFIVFYNFTFKNKIFL